MARLTAVETLLQTTGKPRRTLEVVAICEEEGSGFNTNFWGSRAIVGAIDRVDAELAEAMRERGLDPGRVATAARDDIDTFVELHIEQGAVLESSGTPLAVVSAIVGTAQLAVTVTGRADHAGTTPMTMRHDALAGAAAMIQAIEGLARSHGAPAVATVGRIRAAAESLIAVLGDSVPAYGDSLVRRRHRYLRTQLGSLAARAGMLGGKRLKFDQEAKALYDAGNIKIVDVRVKNIYDQGHIKGAANAPEAELGTHTIEVGEAGPVRADAITPGGQDHRLHSAARIRDADGARRLFVRDDHSCARVHDVGPGAHQRAELLQTGALAHHDEMPRLAVGGARGQPARFRDPAHDVGRDLFVCVLTNRQHRPHRLENFVGHASHCECVGRTR